MKPLREQLFKNASEDAACYWNTFTMWIKMKNIQKVIDELT
jgi:hypothetical protein